MNSKHIHSENFPLPYVLFLVGYGFILFLDWVVASYFGDHHHKANIYQCDKIEIEIEIEEEKLEDNRISVKVYDNDN